MTAVIITAVVSLVIIICLFRWIAKQDNHINDLEKKRQQDKSEFNLNIEHERQKFVNVTNLSQTQSAKIDDLKREVKTLKEDKSDVIDLTQKLNHRIEGFKNDIKKLTEAKAEVNSRYMNVTGKLSEFQSKVEQLNKKAFAQGIQLNELRKEKKSLQNQIAVAWKQVQSHKVDENGVQRTLTGAIDAKLDELEKSLIEKNKAIEELQQSHKGLIVELNSQKVSKKYPTPAKGGRTTKTTKK